MIAACPRCNARYRVDPERIGAEGARLRCARCQAVFRVRAPQAAAPAAAAAPAPSAAPAEPLPVPGPDAPAPPPEERARVVLVADPEIEAGKRTAAAVAAWGLEPVLVHDGVEAMLAIQRLLPQAVVLDAALPKMYGFQVCEVVKRNESLRDTRVVLVGTVHHQDRYRRPPSQLYGADHYLERPDLPDGLLPLLRQAGLPAVAPEVEPEVQPPRPAPVAAPPAPAAAAPAVPDAAPAAAGPAEASPAEGDALAMERAKAERLARIIVSDIVLYNPQKFEAAIASGNVVEALDDDLGEGRALFQQRIDPRVREERDYLAAELLRVAREKGGK